jgi:predicted nucleotidyltransferase
MASRTLSPPNGLDPRNLPPLLRRVVERYVRAFAPERIVLFGSYAKGTNQQSSDVDLLVVADLEGDPQFYLRRARQLAADCFPLVDVVFAATEEFESAATAKSPFLLSILEGGIIVYRRPAISGAERLGDRQVS